MRGYMPHDDDTKVILGMLTSGLADIDDATDSIERLIANMASVLINLKTISEASGLSANVFMDRLDDIIDVLKHHEFAVAAAVVANTELDV
jgi:hypothetical protein